MLQTGSPDPAVGKLAELREDLGSRNIAQCTSSAMLGGVIRFFDITLLADGGAVPLLLDGIRARMVA